MMDESQLSGVVISRRRKKYKFAYFNALPNCVDFEASKQQLPDILRQKIDGYFIDKERPLTVEVAAGNAQFSLQLAIDNPDRNFIAADIKSDRLYTSARRAHEEKVDNIIFVRLSVQDLPIALGRMKVDELWVTFPDPHPKKRSIKHRLTHPSFLRQYRDILRPGAAIRFKTDSRDLFLWSLEQFVADDWCITELSFDLHESKLSSEYKIKTYYEQKFTQQGIPTNFCSVVNWAALRMLVL